MEVSQQRELIAGIRVGGVRSGMWPWGALSHALPIGTVDEGQPEGGGRGTDWAEFRSCEVEGCGGDVVGCVEWIKRERKGKGGWVARAG